MIKGFKAMNSNMECRGFKFEVGGEYRSEAISMCSKGFHFCENIFDVYNYYEKSENTVICEVEALGKVLKEEDKSVTDHIRIVRKLTDKELLSAWIKRTNSGHYNSGNRNSGDYNSGHYNSGNRNSGDYNSGHYNSGHYNSGNRNSGHYNSGHYNSGNRNSGDYNSGYYNSGYYNSGDYNSGDYNSGHYNSGFFNSDTPTVRLFNKDSGLSWTDDRISRLKLLPVKPILQWVSTGVMTEEEKTKYPSHTTTGGFLRKTDRMNWDSLSNTDKELIKSLPGFDDQIFKSITGISLEVEIVEVSVNGKITKITKAKALEIGLIEKE